VGKFTCAWGAPGRDQRKWLNLRGPARYQRRAFCEQPAQTQWVGGDDLDEVIVACCSDHVSQARTRWEELYARFNEEVDN
jgi:hypothetical protein